MKHGLEHCLYIVQVYGLNYHDCCFLFVLVLTNNTEGGEGSYYDEGYDDESDDDYW